MPLWKAGGRASYVLLRSEKRARFHWENNAFNRTAIPLILCSDKSMYPSAKRGAKQPAPRMGWSGVFYNWLDSICPTENVNFLMLKLVKKQFRLQV
jgi:hypothetical protein